MIRETEYLVNEVIWKEYLEYSKHLEELVEDIVNDVITKIHRHEEEDIIQGELE